MNIATYLYEQFMRAGMTKEGACALLANIQAESGFNPRNLEDTANRQLGLTDEQYTDMVDSGKYTSFINDGAGYGLAQITYHTRKEWMLGFARSYGSSIGDYKMQTDYILWELFNKYRAIWNRLTTEHDLKALTWLLLDQWENPAEKTNNMVVRYGYAQNFFVYVKDKDYLPSEAESARENEQDEQGNSAPIVEKYVQYAINIANDNGHGYSQQNRWGPDFDCSSMTIACVQAAGIPVKDSGATYTGNMRKAFLACGFKDVTGSCNLANGAGMARGDILLNDVNHAAIYIGNGQLVHARSSEGNSVQGDQSGNEIRVQAYFNYPWNIIMRYGGGATVKVSGNPAQESVLLKKGSKGANVKVLQNKLIALGYDVGPDGADGEFGANTEYALRQFQSEHGIEVDGVFGPETYAVMKSAKPKTEAQAGATNTAVSSAPAGKTVYLSKGATVRFTGSMCYTSADGDQARVCKPGKAKVTNVKEGARHPYFLTRTLLGGSNVYGWVDRAEIGEVLK